MNGCHLSCIFTEQWLFEREFNAYKCIWNILETYLCFSSVEFVKKYQKTELNIVGQKAFSV
jgi:hypothetical protein